ncbi:MAG: hypothetical protein ABJC66_01100 [Gammaproteobacteria bacterium]
MISTSRHSSLAAVGGVRHAGASGFLQAGLELLVIVVGASGLIHDSQLGSARIAATNLHNLFGALLWLWVIARFHSRVNELPRMQANDLRAFARHLSRRVYLLLYGLMFLKLSLGVLYSALHGAPFVLDKQFQSYLAWGVFALITIHASAALCLRFPIRGGVGNGRLTYRESASPKRQG